MTALIAGIDEAGLGPLLGPLTIGWSVLEIPSPRDDPWQLLRQVIAPHVAKAHKRVVVADSKKVYARNPTGRARLEKTALCFLAQCVENSGEWPIDPRSFLFGPLHPSNELVARHPWYKQLEPVPRYQSSDALELASATLERGLRRAAVSVLDAGVRLVPAGELNASYRETDNKSDTVWRRTLEVLTHIWRKFGQEGIQITVDLQGARNTYGSQLARGFADASVTRVEERPRYAVYRMDERGPEQDTWRPRRMELIFREKGDVHSFPVALASCLAKYAREISMEAFNAHFGQLNPALCPTAGYTTDGRRWLADARDTLAKLELPSEVLIRTR